MFQFLNYNFFADNDSLNCAPSIVNNINDITIQNAIYNHFNITQNINTPVSTDIPTMWDYDTIFDADFNGNLNAGNVDFLAEQILSIKIKRRVVGDANWLTLKTIPINGDPDNLTFAFNDLLNKCNIQYEYALVPIMGSKESPIEGNYITNNILSQFNGVFIGDANTIYKFLYEVNYNNNARNQQVGIFQVLGQQFPIFVANGSLSYESGSVTATILNTDFEQTGIIDKTAILQQKNAIKDFLTNKKAKILKDWAGNEWLCVVNSNIGVTYKPGSGMTIPVINFEWTEIGHADNQQDLYTNGILDEVT